MPGLSGIDTLKEIKKIKPEIEVVIITALATNGQESFRVGASDFITKPFDATEVTTVIRKFIEHRNASLKYKNVISKLKDPHHL